MKIVRFVLILMTFLFSTVVSAELYAPQPRDPFIKDSYIVTFKPSKPGVSSVILPPVIDPKAIGKWPTRKLDQPSSGQSKEELAATLGIKGKVLAIFEANNAAHLQIDAAQAEKLRWDSRVLAIEQDKIVVSAQTAPTVQNNPGWGLDRMDQPTTVLNQQYVFNANGAGQRIVVMDSGLDLVNPLVASEFGGRANFLWDANGASGADCNGHGTQVASVAAGATFGLAKGATVYFAKIGVGCTRNSAITSSIFVFDWLTANAANIRGTIVNWSNQFSWIDGRCDAITSPALENSIRNAFNAGIIVVVAAGNDGCNTANFSPTNIPESFVVGATDTSRLSFGQDARVNYSRFGNNISTFAPGDFVAAMNFNGQAASVQGTSFSAPYISGLFAAACQRFAPYCNDPATTMGALYDAVRGAGTTGTVVNPGGAPLPAGTPSRFISRQPW